MLKLQKDVKYVVLLGVLRLNVMVILLNGSTHHIRQFDYFHQLQLDFETSNFDESLQHITALTV